MTKIAMPDPLEIDWPELHSQALGCGVEDRGIHDRYEAAEYGWHDGVEKAIERVPEQIFVLEQMEAYAAARVREALEPVTAALERICTVDRAGECESIAMDAISDIRALTQHDNE